MRFYILVLILVRGTLDGILDAGPILIRTTPGRGHVSQDLNRGIYTYDYQSNAFRTCIGLYFRRVSVRVCLIPRAKNIEFDVFR